MTIWKTTFAVLLPIYGHKCWKKVIENWTSRLDYIRASRGSPMPEIKLKIFHDANWVAWLVCRWPFCTKDCGFNPCPSQWIFMMPKIDNGHVGGNWASKLPAAIGIHRYGAALKRGTSFRECTSEANPQVYVETPLHPEKLTVWCALWAGGIIGPYFFKSDEGHNVTVNGDRYRAMITNFFIPELNNHDVQELWFQQDGATCHTARATIDLLKDTFGDRLISRFGPVNWPPRSCDLTPLDYFLWGYVKSLVYADKPQTLHHLEDNIRRVIADIRPQMLEKVIENWTSRLDYIRASRGNLMPEIIFKM
ncbi:putative transposable element [Trichonephila clavipes]|nr:putative transposable element [Trichonephila clavipes]